MSATDTVISADRLTRLYGVVIGCNDVTVDLPPGVRGLLGPNGSGKSTFLKMVTGQLKPTRGSVTVLGEDPWNNPDLFRRVGFCPEQDAFWSFMTGHEFVTALARMGGFDPATAAQKADVALGRSGATDFMHRPISTYSKGMRQRTKVAQAIVHEPELVILDEPLNGTDPVGRRELMELIRWLGEQGVSVLVSSHVLHEVQAMTDEFTMIINGRVLASGNIHDIRGLLDKIPHRISIRCSDPRKLGWHLMRDVGLIGVEIAPDGEMIVQTHDTEALYRQLATLVEESGVEVQSMSAGDDDLESVFTYLMQGV